MVAPIPFVLLALTLLVSQTPERPTIAPVYSDNRYPIFLITCRNSSSSARPEDSWDWIRAYRIDGVLPPPAVFGGAGPAPPRPGQEPDRPLIQPDQDWQGQLVLVPPGGEARLGPQVLGTSRRIASQRLTAGRHTIAVQCFDTWSDEFVFYWEGATPD